MSTENERTVEYYERYAVLYRERNRVDYATSRGQRDDKIHSDYILKTLEGLPKSARMFEVGSGYGRDAKLIRAQGYEIQVSDVADSFLEMLRENWLEPVKFDLTQDGFPDKYDYILANAVLVHFTKDEVESAVEKVYNALNPGGTFAVSFKQRLGGGEDWKANIAEAPEKCYFSYWDVGEVTDMLERHGFTIVSCQQVGGMRACWLNIICRK